MTKALMQLMHLQRTMRSAAAAAVADYWLGFSEENCTTITNEIRLVTICRQSVILSKMCQEFETLHVINYYYLAIHMAPVLNVRYINLWRTSPQSE